MLGTAPSTPGDAPQLGFSNGQCSLVSVLVQTGNPSWSDKAENYTSDHRLVEFCLQSLMEEASQDTTSVLLKQRHSSIPGVSSTLIALINYPIMDTQTHQSA